MKNLKNVTIVLLLMIGLSITSCRNEEFIEEPIVEVDISNLIDFKGLSANHRFDTPIEDLEVEHNEKNLKMMFRSIKQKVAQKRGIAFKNNSDELPDVETILEGAKEVFDQFPYQEIQEEDAYETQDLDSIQITEIEQEYVLEQEQKAEANWEMIKQDFPTMTEQEIQDNIETIDEYYAQNLDYVVFNEIANNEDEIAGRVAQRRAKKKSSKSSGIYNATCILANFQSPWNFINPIPSFLPGGGFNYTLSAIALGIASDQANTTSNNYYTNINGISVGEGNTIRDAYRHITWCALLAQHYYAIASKHKRLKFSEAISYANEVCGNNAVDSRQMDYHNNEIGRKIWKDNTHYIKFLGIIIGLRRPSVSTIKRLARQKLDYHSCFIVKRKREDRFPENLLSENKTDEEIQSEVLVHNPDKLVYFIGPIAKSRYEWVEVPTGYDYTPCYNGDYLNCPTIIYEWVQNEIISCYKL